MQRNTPGRDRQRPPRRNRQAGQEQARPHRSTGAARKGEGMKPIKGAVYFLFNKGELVYIGQSNNVYLRIGQHIKEGEKIFDEFRIYETDDYIRLEAFLIGALRPKYNKTFGTDIGWLQMDNRLSKDEFSACLPPEKILKIIERANDALHDRILLRKAMSENPDWDTTFCSSLVMKHMHEIPVFHYDGNWYIDKDWYEKNKQYLWKLIEQWAREKDDFDWWGHFGEVVKKQLGGVFG